MTELLQAPPQDIIRGVRPAQRAVNATLQSDGVNLVLDAVSEEEDLFHNVVSKITNHEFPPNRNNC